MVESQLISELEAVIDRQPVDEVFVALPRGRYHHLIETIVATCEEQGIIVRVQTESFNLKVARWQPDELDGKPFVTIQSGPSNAWHLAMKRIIDIFGSAVLLLGMAPILVIVALLIKLDSPGPVFFTQNRVGLNRRRFRLFKFRTMAESAEEKQHELEHLNEADGPVFKIRNDPRVTRIGRFLRRFSIDELPQLFNVFKGDMSLVGPRPLPLRDVERINAQWHKRRFSMKPGVTCLWQVNGRSDVSFDDWVVMDLEYIDKWSLGLDMRILLRTVPTVLKGSGAY
jgi:exopolysaccharide biosynthesis polyprenyl glycosylphosphotransferase